MQTAQCNEIAGDSDALNCILPLRNARSRVGQCRLVFGMKVEWRRAFFRVTLCSGPDAPSVPAFHPSMNLCTAAELIQHWSSPTAKPRKTDPSPTTTLALDVCVMPLLHTLAGPLQSIAWPSS